MPIISDRVEIKRKPKLGGGGPGKIPIGTASAAVMTAIAAGLRTFDRAGSGCAGIDW